MSVMNKIKAIIHTTFNVKRALSFVWQSSKGWAILNIVLLIVQGVLPIVSMYLFKIMVDTVVGEAGIQDGKISSNVYLIIIAVGVIMLLIGLSRNIGNLVNKEQSRRVVDYMHDIIQKKAIDVDLQYYENPEYQDSLHRAQEESAFRPSNIVHSLTIVFQNAISLLGVAWLLLIFKWQVFFILVIAVFPSMIVRFIFSSKEYLNERNYTKKERAAAYYHWLVVERKLAKEIRLFNIGKTFIERFQKLRSELREIRFNLDKKNSFYSTIAHICTTVIVFTAYLWIAHDAVLGIVSIGSFVMFYQAFQKGQTFLQSFLEGIARLYENNLFLTNLYEFLDTCNTITSLPDKSRDTVSSDSFLEIRNIHFSYPYTRKQVLSGLNMKVDSGEVAAVVGLNGSGKTTLVKLISRLYDVDSGSILLQGEDIRTSNLQELRKKIGVIFQDYAHYNVSARDNIWLGDVSKLYNSQKIYEAAVHAGADTIIKNLTYEYDTVLGRMFENGSELSEGQWQKIALARLFFKDSSLVVLDEPTSSMDPHSEYELFKSFKKILNGRTALLISHRMSTVKMADKIFVLDKGSIAESGTHSELMSRKGLYADMFETQAQNYNVSEFI